MSQDKDFVSDAELHAYVDNQLDPGRRAAIQAYLRQHPDSARRVQLYQTINQGLHVLFDKVLDEPMPARLKQSLRLRRPWLQGAALAGMLVLGSVGGWFLRSQTGAPNAAIASAPLVAEALLAHTVYTPEGRHAVEVPADQEQHLVAWLSKRLDTELRAPDLRAAGFTLLGGRLLAANVGPAAHFMYENEAKQRLTLFAARLASARTNPDPELKFAQQDRTNAIYWIGRDLGYALLGELDQATLARLAHTVQAQLSPQ